jgi:hypothetical protein
MKQATQSTLTLVAQKAWKSLDQRTGPSQAKRRHEPTPVPGLIQPRKET